MSPGDVTISERDFGRLEGTVNGIEHDIKELRHDVTGIYGRLSRLETSTASLVSVAQNRTQQVEVGLQSEEVKQTTRQTITMVAALAVAAGAFVFSIVAYLVH